MATNEQDNYEIRVGIEEEVFLVNQEGFLAPYADQLAQGLLYKLKNNREFRKTIKTLLMGIQWEPNPAQIEYVTRPLPIEKIREAIKLGRETFGEIAQDMGMLILPYSVHPVQSNPHPLNGTHINISVINRKRTVDREIILSVYRHIRNHLPEIIALTANSPMMGGRITNYASSRLAYSRVLMDSTEGKLRRVSYFVRPREKRDQTKYAIMFQSFKQKERKIIIDNYGRRFMDITVRGPYTNILEDLAKRKNETRIEIRAIDNQLRIDHLCDIVKIIVGLTFEALDKISRGEKIKPIEKYVENKLSAIKNGVDGTYETSSGTEPMKDRVEGMIERIQDYLEKNQLKLETNIKHGIPEAKEYGKILLVDPYPQVTKYILSGRIFANIKVKKPIKAYDLFHKEVKIKEGKLLTGMLVPYYKLTLKSSRGVIEKIEKIEIQHWVLTQNLYIPYSDSIIIRTARGPIKQLRNQLELLGRSLQ